MINIRELTGTRPVASAIRILPGVSPRPARLPPGRRLRRSPPSRRRPGPSSATPPAARTCRTASSSTRSSSSPSTRTAPSPSTAHRAEMGTGSRTSLPMVLADEMGADWARVRIVQAPGDETLYGNQDTDGSRSMRHHIQSMRQMGAAVRTMLARAAAAQWQVEPDGGRRRGPRGRVADRRAARLRRPRRRGDGAAVPPFEELTFKDEADFRYIGKGNVPITDLHDITVGKAVYGADVVPAGDEVRRGGAAAGRRRRGQVLRRGGGARRPRGRAGGGAEGHARRRWSSRRSAASPSSRATPGPRSRPSTLLEIEWENGAERRLRQRSLPRRDGGDRRGAGQGHPQPGRLGGGEGRGGANLRAAATTRRTWRTRRWSRPSRLPRWRPTVGRDLGAGAEPLRNAADGGQARSGCPTGAVTVHPTLLGGGFGRKSKCDFALEAALISKEVGAPVRVQWSREDDIRHGYYHSTSVDRIEAAVDADGKVTGWLHRVVAPSIESTFAPDAGYLGAWETGMGQTDLPLRHPGDPLRERPGDGPCAHRLVALGAQRAAGLRPAVLRRRARRGARPRPPRGAARADRAGAAGRPGGDGDRGRALELRREAGGLSRSTPGGWRTC